MKKLSLCACGSGKPTDYCCKKGWQITSFTHEFTYPGEREEMIKKLQISKQFEMRNRGLMKFYGNDLIAWKLRKPSDPIRNEFLRILAGFMADYLEDNCPDSWQQCGQPFWEELVAAYLPHCIHISQQEQEHRLFLSQLRRFAYWIDKREKTSILPTIETLSTQLQQELSICESLLNRLTETAYPGILSGNLDINKTLERNFQKLDSYYSTLPGLFEVSSSINSVFKLIDLETGSAYHVTGLPESVPPGFLLQGAIGKGKGTMFWEWCYLAGVFPPSSKKFFKTKEHVVVL
ncbi:hypothetical protein A8F94_20330 [Bacillus sp. FJAT-27225]|uniref:hypothetical protein n=1 Tax=Bacillus sp. FJAT-27225 TaxID=1743144 RepID=UPI00080C2055|nr:hypothetical protein [Bacillus sp. FJAT-27225]OCA82263.1 hypothetical protein A8F94_20330 [Bacillus sp. FJAT-27225]